MSNAECYSRVADLCDDQEAKEYQTLWGEISVPFNLREGLSKYKKYDLDDIRKTLGIPGVSSLKKDDLIAVLEERIASVENRFLLWDAERLGWLTAIVKNDGHLPAGNLNGNRSDIFVRTD